MNRRTHTAKRAGALALATALAGCAGSQPRAPSAYAAGATLASPMVEDEQGYGGDRASPAARREETRRSAVQTPRRVVVVAPANNSPRTPAASGAGLAGMPDTPTAPPPSIARPGGGLDVAYDQQMQRGPRDMAAVAGSLRTLEDRIARGEAALSTATGECATVCRAASDICTAAREVCELTDEAAGSFAGGDVRCARARDACERAARQREGACPVCPST